MSQKQKSEARRERLAAELRANLRRRKVRAAVDSDASPGQPASASGGEAAILPRADRPAGRG